MEMSEDFVGLVCYLGILFGYFLSLLLYYSWLPLGLGLLMSHAIIKLHECYLEVVTENSKNDHNGLKKDNNVQRSIGDDCEDTAELIIEQNGSYNIEQGLVGVDTQLPVDKCIAFQAHVDCETDNKGNREKNVEHLNVIIPTCKILGQRTIVKEFRDAEKLCNVDVTECEHERTNAMSSKKESKKVGEVPCEEHEETFTDRVENNQHIEAAITINTKQEDLQNISTPFRARVPYELSLTVAIFNICAVPVTPAHLFSRLLDMPLDSLIAISLAWSMVKTIIDVCIFLKKENKYVLLLIVLFYVVVDLHVVFFIYTYSIFLMFVELSMFYLLLVAFWCCYEGICKRRTNGFNDIPCGLGS